MTVTDHGTGAAHFLRRTPDCPAPAAAVPPPPPPGAGLAVAPWSLTRFPSNRGGKDLKDAARVDYSVFLESFAKCSGLKTEYMILIESTRALSPLTIPPWEGKHR